MTIPSRFAACLVVIVQFAAAAASAASLEVVPTTIELPAKGGPAQLRLVNHGDKSVNVQIETFAWTQDGEETLADTEDVALSPPFAHLNPLSSQIIRLLVPSPVRPDTERAFRVLVTQLPDPDDKESGTHVLLQFSVPLFAGNGTQPQLTWSLHRSSTGLKLEADNQGDMRAKFTNLELVSTDGHRRPVSSHGLVYVLAGVKRSWAISDISSSRDLRLEGDDDSARLRFSIPLSVTD